MSDRPAAFEPYEPTGQVLRFPVRALSHPRCDPDAALPHSDPVGNRYVAPVVPAQPRDIRLRIIPAHARHRMPICLWKAGIPPRIGTT